MCCRVGVCQAPLHWEERMIFHTSVLCVGILVGISLIDIKYQLALSLQQQMALPFRFPFYYYFYYFYHLSKMITKLKNEQSHGYLNRMRSSAQTQSLLSTKLNVAHLKTLSLLTLILPQLKNCK